MQTMFQTMLQFIKAQLAHLHAVNEQCEQDQDCDQNCHQNHHQFFENQIIQNDNLESSVKTKQFHPLDLEFFNSLYMNIDAQNKEPIITSEKEVIYKDIHIFIERVWTYNVVSKKTIQKNLKSCLKGNVLNWHFMQLSEIKQKFLTFNDDEDSLINWTSTLLHQFKKDVDLTQKAIFKKHYMFKNAICKHELRKYINQIIHNFKFTNLSVYNQLIVIRDSITVELQQSVLMITKNTHVLNIFNIINNVKTNWWALEVKLIQNSNKDCWHSEQPNQEPVNRENQVISGHQSAHSYPTYPLNLNTGNYEFPINSFNSMFSTTLYPASFPFVYPQNI